MTVPDVCEAYQVLTASPLVGPLIQRMKTAGSRTQFVFDLGELMSVLVLESVGLSVKEKSREIIIKLVRERERNKCVLNIT